MCLRKGGYIIVFERGMCLRKRGVFGKDGYVFDNNTHIAAIAPLPLATHPRSWAELLTFGPKCTLPF